MIEDKLYKVISVPIYKVNFRVTLIDNLTEYEDFMQYNVKKDDHAIACVIETIKRRDLAFCFDFIVVDSQKKTPDIVHEVFHLTRSIMKYIGSTLTDGSEECWAYLNEWLYSEIINCINELKIKKEE